MSYVLPCGRFGDLALLVERLTKGKEILRYGVLSV